MKRVERIGLRITPLEKIAVEKLAEIEGGLSMAALVRRLIRQAAQNKGVWPIQDDPESKILGEMEVPMCK